MHGPILGRFAVGRITRSAVAMQVTIAPSLYFPDLPGPQRKSVAPCFVSRPNITAAFCYHVRIATSVKHASHRPRSQPCSSRTAPIFHSQPSISRGFTQNVTIVLRQRVHGQSSANTLVD